MWDSSFTPRYWTANFHFSPMPRAPLFNVVADNMSVRNITHGRCYRDIQTMISGEWGGKHIFQLFTETYAVAQRAVHNNFCRIVACWKYFAPASRLLISSWLVIGNTLVYYFVQISRVNAVRKHSPTVLVLQPYAFHYMRVGSVTVLWSPFDSISFSAFKKLCS